MLTVAIAVLLLLHVPPLTVEDRVVVALGHTVETPDSVPALVVALTVTTLVAVAVPQAPLTV